MLPLICLLFFLLPASNDGSSIRVCEDFEEKMKNRLAVVLKYVDGNENLEMQCIYALQALCVKHQYPQGKIKTPPHQSNGIV